MDFRVTSAGAVMGLFLLAAGGCGGPPSPASPAETTPEEARALAAALRPRLEPPAAARWQQVGAGGRHQVLRTGDRLGQVTVVGRAADGTLRIGCASTAAEVEAVLAGGLRRGGGRK